MGMEGNRPKFESKIGDYNLFIRVLFLNIRILDPILDEETADGSTSCSIYCQRNQISLFISHQDSVKHTITEIWVSN